MKHVFMALLLALVAPSVAFAQQPGPMGPGMMSLHNQARTAVLNALTPAHKALLSSIVGGLAVAASPDPDAAAAKLDAALSATEKQQILAAVASMRDHMHAMMSPPPGMSPHAQHSMKLSDPGEILLMMSSMSMMGRDGMMHGMPH